eukprot:Lithocolla_globosa_v1_NODE_8102_length_861_cov_58.148883.p1 type:complete len:150 gc:universal NODE_8102_length_861_cov_58.148883:338-787(+)
MCLVQIPAADIYHHRELHRRNSDPATSNTEDKVMPDTSAAPCRPKSTDDSETNPNTGTTTATKNPTPPYVSDWKTGHVQNMTLTEEGWVKTKRTRQEQQTQGSKHGVVARIAFLINRDWLTHRRRNAKPQPTSSPTSTTAHEPSFPNGQ